MIANFITEPFIRATRRGGVREALSLPGVLAGLDADVIESFDALRPHQRHVWHAFLVQVAVLAMQKTGDRPQGEESWRAALRALTPDFPEDEPWSLVVEDLSRPALLQPPVPEGTLAGFKNEIATPDALDMLVSAKNHDLKPETMDRAALDDWLFALVSLQTQEGFLGAGNYGVSRMNGGFSSRPGLGLAPAGGLGARWRRDCDALIAALAAPRPEWAGYDLADGLGLVWLRAWDGAEQIARPDLHPLYVEICRRVRLVGGEKRVVARTTGTKAARIFMAKDAGGATGDPWTPMSLGKEKALTVPADGFTYRRMSELLFGDEWALPLLARPMNGESGPLVLIARALTRGQGRTEGLHERRVRIPSKAATKIFGSQQQRDEVALLSKRRIETIGELQQTLVFALRILVQGAPDAVAAKASRNAFCDGLAARLQEHADRGFFDDLWSEAEAEGEARDRVRFAWMKDMLDYARGLLRKAGESLPQPVMRRPKARYAAAAALEGGIRKKPRWSDFFEQERRDRESTKTVAPVDAQETA